MTKARDTANLTGSGVTLPLLDIDAGTDIGAALVDADLMIVDDGAGGTNRKATMSRLATYMGTKITGGSMVFIASSGAISNAATVDFTQFDATAYDSYEFAFLDVLPATDDVELRALTSSDTSSHSYDTGSSDYMGPFGTTSVAAFGRILSSGNPSSNVANEAFSGSIRVWNPHTSFYTNISPIGGSVTIPNGTPYGAQYAGFGFKRQEAAQVNAIRFYMESGNIASGEIVMYGIANGS